MQLEIPTPGATHHNGWLSDTIIDATQAVLRQQFPHDEGMQSVLYAAKPEFQPVSERFVQIINTHPDDGGLHCVLST